MKTVLRNRWVLLGVGASPPGSRSCSDRRERRRVERLEERRPDHDRCRDDDRRTRLDSGRARQGAGRRRDAKLFNGIPQQLNVLGKPERSGDDGRVRRPPVPVLPRLRARGAAGARRPVRPHGKAKFVFSGIAFIGPDSETALRAVYAAGLQSRLWKYLDLLYRNQGAENSGWVTDGLLRAAGASIPGFDTEKMLADMSSPTVTNAIAAADQQAQSAQRQPDADVLRRADGRRRSSTSTSPR